MNTKTPLTKFAVYTLLAATSFLGVNIASVMMDKYKVIVDGILGLVVLYLIYRPLLSPKREEADETKSNDFLFRFPTNIKAFIFIFVGSIVSYWAGKELFIVVLFLIKQIATVCTQRLSDG